MPAEEINKGQGVRFAVRRIQMNGLTLWPWCVLFFSFYYLKKKKNGWKHWRVLIWRTRLFKKRSKQRSAEVKVRDAHGNPGSSCSSGTPKPFTLPGWVLFKNATVVFYQSWDLKRKQNARGYKKKKHAVSCCYGKIIKSGVILWSGATVTTV